MLSESLIHTFRISTAVLASTCCFVLACIAFFGKERSKSVLFFIVSNLSLSIWNLNDLLVNHVPENFLLPTFRLSLVAGFLVVPSFFLLILHLISQNEKYPTNPPKPLIYSLFVLIGLAMTSLIIKEIRINPQTSAFEVIPGKLYFLFVIYTVSWATFGLYRLYKSYLVSEDLKRNQIKYFFFAISIALIAAVNFFICMFVPAFPPVYYIVEIFYALVVAYSVVRYRLMDFNLLIRWGVAYGGLALACGTLFGSMVYSMEKMRLNFEIPGLPTLFGTLVLVAIYDPLKNRTIKFIDKFIFQSPDMRLILEGFEESINQTMNFESLTNFIAQRLKSIWPVEIAGVAVWNSLRNEFEQYPKNEFEHQIIQSIGRSITPSDFLVRTLESERRLFQYGIISEDELTLLGSRSSPGERITFWKMRRTMRWLGAAICAPIMNGEHLLGFIVLGKKKQGAFFNGEDRKFLAHLSELVAGPTKKLILEVNMGAK